MMFVLYNSCNQPYISLHSLKAISNFESLYKSLGGTYREKNGHHIPDITLPEQTEYETGKYVRMHLDYIKSKHRGRYTTLLTEDKLNARLHEIDLEANKKLDIIIPLLATERGIDETLKARDMLR